MMAITTSSSISVKPRGRDAFIRGDHSREALISGAARDFVRGGREHQGRVKSVASVSERLIKISLEYEEGFKAGVPGR